MSDLPSNTPPELQGWDEIIKRAESDAKSGKSTSVIIRAAQKVTNGISNLTANIDRLGREIERSARDLNSNVNGLNQKISEFSDSTTHLSKKANKLIFWYVALTAVIAVATVVNIFF